MIYEDDYRFITIDYAKSRDMLQELLMIGSELLRVKAIPKKKIKEKARETLVEDLLQRENFLIMEMARARGLIRNSRN